MRPYFRNPGIIGACVVALALAAAGVLVSQTVVNGGRTYKGAQDASLATSTSPIKAGTTAASGTGTLASFYFRRGQSNPQNQLFVYDPANTPVAIGGVALDGNAAHFYNGVGGFTVPAGAVSSVNGATGAVTVAQAAYTIGGNLQAASVASGQVRFVIPNAVAFQTGETSGQLIAPFTGTLRNLSVTTTATQGITSTVVVVRTCTPTAGACTGSNSTLTVTIAAAATANVFSDTTHTPAVTQGDFVSIQFTQTAGAASTTFGVWSATLLAN